LLPKPPGRAAVMTLCIRNPEADALAKRLAKMDDTTVSKAVLNALKEAVQSRLRRETATEAAKRILAEHGLEVKRPGVSTPPEVYHDLDGDLLGPD